MGYAIAAGCVAILAIGLYLWLRWLLRRKRRWFSILNNRIPVHSNWWREQRDKPGELLYVAIGDSAAQGIGASTPARSYVGMLAASMRESSGLSIRTVNLAVSGATLSLALRDQIPQLTRLNPDVCTVAIGANDIAAFDATRFAREFDELCRALPPHAIVADLPSFHFLPAERSVKKACEIVRNVAARHGLTTVSLHTRTRRQGLWGVVNQFAGDLFHPNDRGYRVWASAFEPEIAKRMREIHSLRAR